MKFEFLSRSWNRFKNDTLKQHPIRTALVITAVICLSAFAAFASQLTPVTVNDEGTTCTVFTFKQTPRAVLAGAGIALEDGDTITSSPDGKTIRIERAFDVNVSIGEKDVHLRLTDGTVNDALKLAGITVDGGTITDIAVTEPLSDGLTIHVEQLESTLRTETETIDFEVTYEYTDEKPAGSQEYVQRGKKGKKTCTYADYLKDGNVVSSELIEEDITTPPVNAVILVGQGEKSDEFARFPLDKNGVPTTYKQVIEGTACAYTANVGAVTATGTVPQYGTVAVNPKTIPYGSKLYIVSNDGFVYGYATAEDTGGALLKNKIIADLYMTTRDDCFQFGRRTVKVYILE